MQNKFQKHQVFEIPIPKFHVTEYRIYKGCCDQCHSRSNGQLPTGVTWKGFGIRAHAMISLMTSKYRLSKQLVRAWFHDVYQMPMCVGSVSNVEHTVSQSLAPAHQEIETVIHNEKIVHIDETGHKECHKNAWVCQNILDFSKSLWWFFTVQGVPPTNNHAERQLRPLVISKKLTFGTQSDRGSRCIERIFSVVATCKQQGKDVLNFIVNLVYSHFCIEAAPTFF